MADPQKAQPEHPGAFKLFRLLGTDVFLHYSWFIVAYFLIKGRDSGYSSVGWEIAQYIGGFLIVLLHEFGHVLACRSTGGRADRVLLWPLGGLAFVEPPARPWPTLWMTVGGPLVNVVLIPVFYLLAMLNAPESDELPVSDVYRLFYMLAFFNIVVLIFNLLPIYPLDGGRVLQSLLWFGIGRAKSLMVAASIGVIAGVGLAVWSLTEQNWWLAFMFGYLALGAFGGLAEGRRLKRLEAANRHPHLACPLCGKSPPVGEHWKCVRCNQYLDIFGAASECAKGGYHAIAVSCPDCQKAFPPQDWVVRDGAPTEEPPAM